MQGTTTAAIRNLIKESSITFYRRLKLVGVGYRAFSLPDVDKNLLMLKLGYSHSVYVKVPKHLKVFCLKLTNLFIYGNFYQSVNQVAAQIRSYKKPEPYKGKGIRYFDEVVELKEGKKT